MKITGLIVIILSCISQVQSQSFDFNKFDSTHLLTAYKLRKIGHIDSNGSVRLTQIDSLDNQWWRMDTTLETDSIKISFIAGIRYDNLVEIFGDKYLIHKYMAIIKVDRAPNGYIINKPEKLDHRWGIIGGPEDVLDRICGILFYQSDHDIEFVNYTYDDRYMKGRKAVNKKLGK